MLGGFHERRKAKIFYFDIHSIPDFQFTVLFKILDHLELQTPPYICHTHETDEILYKKYLYTKYLHL